VDLLPPGWPFGPAYDHPEHTFVDWAGGDFHLRAPTEAGRTLESPFDVDPDGQRRGADGVWDRGLDEYR